ncbi:MAG: S16 family serine protease [Archaeoglobaceae archaeon]
MLRTLLLITSLVLIAANACALEGNSVTVKAVAVTSGETPRGVTIDITVTVTNGSGKVFVSTGPYTEIDMQGSARLAAITACDLLGMDFLKYDFFYEIQADAPIVGGPSAGAVMTVATIAALKNLPIRDDVFMTGMIYPDGFIGPVGGLKYKLEAAAESGGRVFLIPKGQRITYVEERVVERVGIVSIVRTKYTKLDLVEYGRQLGVEVYEVETINDALKFYTGYEIAQAEISFNPVEYSQLLKLLAEEMRKLVDRNAEAESFFERGAYYTATSKYFQALIQKYYGEYKRKITNAQQFDNEVRSIESEIENLKEALATKRVGVNTMQIIAAAEERLGEAELQLEKAKTSNDADEVLFSLAYARARVESAKVWLTLLDKFGEDYEVSYEELKRRAEFYVTQASSLLIYATSLGGNQLLLSWAEESLIVARNLYSDGMYAGAAFSAIDSMVDSALAIEVTYSDLESKIEAARSKAAAAIGEAEKSLTPILPAAYFEYAENLENPYFKLLYYKLSERLAKLLSVMSKSHGKAKLVQAKFTPKQESRVKEIVREVREIPGFEVATAVLALAALHLLRRRS